MFDDYKNEQPIAYEILKNSFNHGKNSHAYLIEKINYNKAFEFVLSFAKEIINNNTTLDLKIIKPENNIISKEKLKELQKDFSTKSISNNNRIYIIDEAQKMNKQSENALLKFLEEPEDGIIAFLIVDNVYNLLDTIVSRCQIIHLNNVYNKKNNKDEDVELFKTVMNFVNEIEIKKSYTIVDTKSLWHEKITDSLKREKAFKIMLLFYKDCLNYKFKLKLDYLNDNDLIIKISNLNNEKQLIKKTNYLNYLLKNSNLNLNKDLLIDKLIIDFEV